MLSFPEPKVYCPVCAKQLYAQGGGAFIDGDTEITRVYECKECGWEGVVRYTVKAEIQEKPPQAKNFAKGKERRKGRSITGKQFKRKRKPTS